MKLQHLLLAAAAFCCLSSEARAEKVWAVDNRSLLLSFDSERPQFLQSLQIISGLQPGEGILAIDFRPANGRLYGLGSSSRLYVIDKNTAVATAVATAPFTPALQGTNFGFDFNPTVDRIRLTSDAGQNLRLHPDTGAVVATDMPLKYADNSTPQVIASAYTNSFAGATTTTLYNIDLGKRGIVVQAPPNDGVLTAMVKPFVNMDMSAVAAFDISPISNRAYLLIRESNSQRCIFYEVYPESGDHNPVGPVWFFEQINGMAIDPAR
jgi:hypothetical protein